MYYQNYEDYMRSVLGYPIQSQNTYETYNYSSEMPYRLEAEGYSNTMNYSDEIMDLYPEIYKIINPMVCKICESNTRPITRELLEKMTDEIYSNLESQPEMDTIINVRVSAPDSNNDKSNRAPSSDTSSLNNNSKSKREEVKREVKTSDETKETRQFGTNRTLRDLIRILILNRLLGGGFFPGRPPRPRPPFPMPGGGGMPPRPPMRPPHLRDDRYYDGYLKF